MKSPLIALAALLIGTPAFAQDSPTSNLKAPISPIESNNVAQPAESTATLQKKTEECVPPKAIKDVMEALRHYAGCTLNQFMEVTGLPPESSVAMPDGVTLYRFVGRAGDGFFTTRRTCVLQVGVNPSGVIITGGFQSAAQSIILNGRGHCLKILRGEKREKGINVPLRDIY